MPTRDTESGLRAALRTHTKDRHDSLDRAVSAFDLTVREDYARFLSFQYAARAPIEVWLAKRAPDIALPPMAPLIAADLAALDATPPVVRPFALPTARGAQGIAWALAGSHLGNRALLVRLQKTLDKAGDDGWPTAFLSDTEMRVAWTTLLPALERPADRLHEAQAIAAATQVFEHFTRCIDAALKPADYLAV